MKQIKLSLWLVFGLITTMLVSCEQAALTPETPNQETLESAKARFKELGFDTYDLKMEGENFLVEGDILVTPEALANMANPTIVEGPDGEQYRTYNLVSTPRTIRVQGVSLSSKMSTALDMAIANYNALNLDITFVRVTSSPNITVTRQNGGAGGVAGFPFGDGRPFNSVTIYSGLDSYTTDVVEHVITHELGHCVGLRHTDWFNRSYSCGSGGNEGQAGVGSHHIPGTPTSYDANSIMLACFNSGVNGEFSTDDRDALNYLYGSTSSNKALNATTTASSTFPGYAAARINDGNRNTTVGGAYSWANAHTSLPTNGRLPQWVELDLGSTKSFNKVVLYTSAGYPIRDYRIQYKSGSSWINAASVTGNTSTQRVHSFSTKSARYIRVYATKGPNNQNIYVRVNELQVYNGSGQNLAIAGVARASTTFPGYSASKINDGDNNTAVGGSNSWVNAHTSLPSNGRLPQWVQLDFGTNRTFSRVDVYTSSGYPLRDYQIQYRSGSSWITLANITGNTSTQRVHTFSSKTGRYIRVYATKGPNNQSIYARVNELEVY